MKWLIGGLAALVIGLGGAPVASATPIGGGAELGCVDDGLDACDIGFTVTRVQQNVTCNDPDHPLGPDGQWLRFDVDFDPLRQQFRTPWAESAFLIENWRVNGMRVVISEKCSGTHRFLPDPFVEPVDVGYRYSRTAVVIAPKNATTLRLDAPDGSQWNWNI